MSVNIAKIVNEGWSVNPPVLLSDYSQKYQVEIQCKDYENMYLKYLSNQPKTIFKKNYYDEFKEYFINLQIEILKNQVKGKNLTINKWSKPSLGYAYCRNTIQFQITFETNPNPE